MPPQNKKQCVANNLLKIIIKNSWQTEPIYDKLIKLSLQGWTGSHLAHWQRNSSGEEDIRKRELKHIGKRGTKKELTHIKTTVNEVLSETEFNFSKGIRKAKIHAEHELKRTWEFDSGSGRTLAACLTHASRAEYESLLLYLAADGWVTREQPAFNYGITLRNRC